MKRPSLLPGMLAATLFLGVGSRAEEAKPANATEEPAAPIPVNAAPSDVDKNAEVAAKRRQAASAAEAARRHALRTELIALFDKNGDGTLDSNELVAVSEFLQKGRIPPGPVSSPAEEQARLERVAVEVAKRRAVREEAAQTIGNLRPALTTESLEETIRSLRASLERLEKVAADRAKEKAKPAGERK